MWVIPIIQRYQIQLLIYRIDTQYLLIRYMGWYGDTMYWTISLLLPFFNDKTYCNFWSHSENFCIAEQNFMKVFETLSEMFQFCHLNSLGSSMLVQLDTQCFNCSLSFKTYFFFFALDFQIKLHSHSQFGLNNWSRVSCCICKPSSIARSAGCCLLSIRGVNKVSW